MSFPMPGDKVNLDFGLEARNERTVIASVWYREREKTDERDMYTVLVLNYLRPYYTTAIVTDVPEHNLLVVQHYEDHDHIGMAVNGDKYREKFGYVDMGGDY